MTVRARVDRTERIESVMVDLDRLRFTPRRTGSRAAVIGMGPVGEFLRQLQRLVPAGTRPALIHQDEEGDTYVDLRVPSADWELYLGCAMAGPTMTILTSSGTYVGLVTIVDPSASGWGVVPA